MLVAGNPVLTTSINLQAEELTQAEQVPIQSIQNQTFYNEIRFLKHRTYPQPVSINQFGLVLDENTIFDAKDKLTTLL